MNQYYNISKLYPLSSYKAKIQEKGNLDDFIGRLLGNTTGSALETISMAMLSPHRVITFSLSTQQRTKVLASMIKELICSLGLKHLDLRETDNTLTYNIYNKVLVDNNTVYVEIK